jgi:hypothetical protein
VPTPGGGGWGHASSAVPGGRTIIQFVDRAVERFLREVVPLDESAVDLSFDAPDRTWGAGLSRPTVNTFLWEIAGDPAKGRAGMQERTQGGRVVERRPATPVVQLHYIITAWASEHSDEHQLLGSVLEAVLANDVLPAELLPERLAGTRCGLTHSPQGSRVPGDFWSALDGRLKPGILIEVSLPLEVFTWKSTAPPAESITLDPTQMAGAAVRPPEPPPKVLRRRRANGALVMEGKPPAPDGT